MAAIDKELKDVYMKQSGEPIRFAHGTYVVTQINGKRHCELTLNNVQQQEMFDERKEEDKPVEMTFTTQENESYDVTFKVKTVNRFNEQRNVVELENQ